MLDRFFLLINIGNLTRVPADYIHAIKGAHHCFTVIVSVHSSIIIFSCLQRPLPSYKVTEYHEPCGLLSENERKVKYVSEFEIL